MKNLFILAIIVTCLLSCGKISNLGMKSKRITYPIEHNSLKNLLVDSQFSVTISPTRYSLTCFLPKKTSIKVVVKPANGFKKLTGWGVFGMENDGWVITPPFGDSSVYSGEGNDKTISVPAMFTMPGGIDMFIYENGAKTPKRKKTFIW